MRRVLGNPVFPTKLTLNTLQPMQQFQLKRYVIPLYVTALLLFVANRFVLRPFVLANDFPQLWQVIVLSLPNTVEAIVGTINIAVLLMIAKQRFAPRLDQFSSTQLHLLALLLAAVYVLTQEFKLHNLGGNNIFDPNDVIASVIGLLGMSLLLLKIGISNHS